MINQQQRESNILENAEEQLIQAEEQYSMLTDEEGTSSGAFVIIAAVVVFGMIAAFLFMRYMLNQSKIKMIEQANERHQKIKNLNNDGSELTHVKMKKGMDNVHGDSDSNGKVMNLQSGDNLDEYEEQYNANHDFAIFQVGNNAVGGLMNLQQKQN